MCWTYAVFAGIINGLLIINFISYTKKTLRNILKYKSYFEVYYFPKPAQLSFLSTFTPLD